MMVTKLFFITLWWLPVGSGHPAEMSSYCHTGANSIHGYTLVPLDGGEETPLSLYEGKVLIIVNVASFCQYTSQYLDFNELKNIAELKGKIEVIGVPSNQFGLQEPGANGEEIRNSLKYVRPGNSFEPDFDLFEKCDVNGANEIALFTALKVRISFFFC